MSALDKELYDAVVHGNVANVRGLLRRGASANYKHGYYGVTLLHRAATKGNVEIAELLIRNKADVNAPDNVEDTPLDKAVELGNVKVADLLIRNRADINAPDKYDVTPLHKAVINGNVEITDMLIRNKADVNAPDNDGVTPLHKAVINGNVEITDMLIKNKADVNAPDNDGVTPLHKAVINGNVEITDMLIKNKADVNAPDNDGDTPLHKGINSYYNQGNLLVMLESLIRLDANVSVSNNKVVTPLHKAVINGNVEITDMLIRNKADVNVPDNDEATPLHKAAVSGNVEVVDLLIRNGTVVNAPDNVGVTPLHKAAVRGNVKVADLLIRNGAVVNFPDIFGATPLHNAAGRWNVEVADLLIRNKADVNAPDNVGNSPLHQAARRRNENMFNALVGLGANVSAVNIEGDTPLHKATDSNKMHYNGKDMVMMVESLIRLGANTSVSNNKGKTPLDLLEDACTYWYIKKDEGNSPLHMAVIYEKENIVTTLITLGADPSARNKEGKTPIDIAEDMYAQKKNSIHEYTYRMMLNVLKGNSHNLIRTRQHSRVIAKTKAPTKDTMASPTTMPSKKSKEMDIQLPWLVDAKEFKRMLSQGTFLSYENRLSLGGPCRAGKSTLASVLIDEKIPLRWNSTDGLVIYFGRNGIDIDQKKMVPLKKGDRGHDVLAKILRGKPDVFNKSKPRELDQKKTSASRNTSKNQKESNTSKSLIKDMPMHFSDSRTSTDGVANQTHTSIANSDRQLKCRKAAGTYMSAVMNDIQKLEVQRLQLQSDILDEVRTGQYKIKIAPSDLIDFGGQKSYDMTHQLFIQHKGSFLLMFDGRYGLHSQLKEYPEGVTAASIIKHWVDSILTYTADTDEIMPMILFAATHRDMCGGDTKKMKECFLADIKEMFSSHEKKNHIHLKTLFFINGVDKNDVEIQRMTDQIVIFAMQQTSWGQRRPMQWVPLELQISNMKMKNINILTKENLQQVNELNADLALNEKQMDDFLLVQHSLGKLMHYNLPGLDNFIIIYPPALVNILRSFVTDEQFWPADMDLRYILETMTKTGRIYKRDLLKIWEQPQFNQYMQEDAIKEFVLKLLVHLDILVVPKAFKQSSADVYIVPCMIKAIRPDFNNLGSQREKTICLKYIISDSSIPSALAYKVIGAAVIAWPLKEENNKPCLYHKAAVLNVSEDDELRIWVDDNRVNIYLTNTESLLSISPDVAASIQECLTKHIESSLLFYHNSFGNNIKPTNVLELYSFAVGIPCGNDVCFTSLQKINKVKSWKCDKDNIHDTKCLLYWIFDKNQEMCEVGEDGCTGLSSDDLGTEPSDKHLVRLGSQIGIHTFKQFFIQLGMTTRQWENTEDMYCSHSREGIMSMALIKWKESKLSNLEKPTLNDLAEALTAANLNTHFICQVFREKTKLLDIADLKLQEPPSDDVLKKLSNQIGNCALQLGIELGISFYEVEKSVVKFPKDLSGLIEDILKKWKATSKIKTTHSLMMALLRVDGGGVQYLHKITK